MGYEDGDALVLKRLRAMPDWDANNTSKEDWVILNQGSSEVYAVLRPGDPPVNEFVSIGRKTLHTTWNTIIELWTLFDEAGTPAARLKDRASDIIAEFAKYPYLGDSTKVFESNVTSLSEMEERWTNSGGPKWAVWEVHVEWKEEQTITAAE